MFMDEQLKDMKLDDSLTEDMTSEAQENNLSENTVAQVVAESSESVNDSPKKDIPNDDTENKTSSAANATKQDEIKPVRPVSAGLPRIQRKVNDNHDFSVILRTQGRAFSQALMTFAGTKQRSSRLWLTFGAMLIIIALLIIQVAYRHRELNLGYALSDAISKREALLEDNRKLRIELRVLSRRERLEPLAGKQLGMTTIQPEQVLIVDLKNKKIPQNTPGKRQDGLDNVRHIGEE